MEILLDLIARLDWFERLDEVVRWMCGVKSWRLSVPRSCGWSGHQIEQLLARHGVKVWGRSFTRTQLCFRVKLQQANWAEYLLWRRGIPVSSRPFNRRNQFYGIRHFPGSEPPPHRRPAKRARWLDVISSLFS